MPYTKFSDLDPIVLYKEDLLELERLLHNDIACNDCEYSISVELSKPDMPSRHFHSCSELLQSDFRGSIDQLEVNIRKANPKGVVEKSIRISLASDICDIHVFSDTDQEWVTSTNRVVNAFFNRHKPWYASVKKMLAPMFNASMVLSLLLALPAMIAESLWLLVFPAAFVSYSLVMMLAGQRQILFPYARIALYPEVDEKRTNYELLWTLGWGVTAILAILSGSLMIQFS